MARDQVRWLQGGALLLGIAGIAIGELGSRHAAVGITFVAFMLGFKAIPTLNVLASRLAFIAAAMLHGLSIWRASHSVLLGAVPAIAVVIIVPHETIGRRMSYQYAWFVPFAFAVALGLTLLVRPYTSWHLALVPSLLVLALFAFQIVTWQVDLLRRARAISVPVGQPFPDFVLSARLGQPEFRLSDHRGRHVLVCLLRGDWCPVCHVMMRILSKDAPVLAAHGVKVVAISADEGAAADDFARALGVDYTLLIDPRCTVAAALGAGHPDTPEPGKNTNLPAMFLVDPEGRLSYSSTALDLTLHDPRRVIHLLSARAPAAAVA